VQHVCLQLEVVVRSAVAVAVEPVAQALHRGDVEVAAVALDLGAVVVAAPAERAVAGLVDHAGAVEVAVARSDDAVVVDAVAVVVEPVALLDGVAG
jgi:hypothetical protein